MQNRGAKIKVVTTIFPEYDWVKEIAGDEISNMDRQCFSIMGWITIVIQPTASDIMKIADCDLFIYVGGESDALRSMMREAVNKNMKVINLLDVLGNTVKRKK
ncbi:MAG: metal ABC transporter solute-binding protein, Zn/Mn family [Dorea sp.]